MKIYKYFTKLSKMSAAEVSFRLRQKGRKNLDGLRWRLHKNNSGSNLFLPGYLQDYGIEQYPFPTDRVKFFGLAEPGDNFRESFSRLFPKKLQELPAEAKAILNHEFHFLGESVKLADPVDWNENPVSGKSYPKDFYSNLNVYDTQRYGDVKFVWELNRHQFFIELGRAYYLTGNEKYVRKLIDFLQSWINNNPYKIGVNWTSALEAAVRIFSWLWAYYFTRNSNVWSEENRTLLIKNLLLQGDFIEEKLSYYYSPYNHLIGELAALSFLGTVYLGHPVAGKWRDKYWKELENQVEKQFHPDGMSVEQASYYHHFTLGFYLMLVVLRQQNNLPVSTVVLERIEKALEFSMYLTRPDGLLPMIGDIDSARSIYFYRPEPHWNLRPFLAIGAVLFERGDMKYVAGEPCEEILWLLGEAGIKTFEKLEARQPQWKSASFFDSGYFIMRDNWSAEANYCCFDCGEIADGVYKDETPSAAHGHGDILSFELSVDGKPLIIDPGFHTYFGELNWHRYFRATRGHNVVEVNGKGQAVHENRIGWSRVSSPRFIQWLSDDDLDWAAGAIDRFAQLDTVFQRRFVLFKKPDYFLIVDEINSHPPGQSFKLESFLHFAPDDIRYENGFLFQKNLKIASVTASAKFDIHIEKGGPNPWQGWVAEGYGRKREAPVLTLEINNPLPVYIGYLFPVGEMRKALAGFTFQTLDDNSIRFLIDAVDWKDEFILNPAGTMIEISNQGNQPARTDALAVVVRSQNKQLKSIYALKVKNVMFEDKTIHSGTTPIAGVKIRLKNGQVDSLTKMEQLS